MGEYDDEEDDDEEYDDEEIQDEEFPVGDDVNDVNEELELEVYHTKQAIMQIEYIILRIQGNPNYMPDGFTSYGEVLRERPGWDMPRMTYTTRFRPPGYPNWR